MNLFLEKRIPAIQNFCRQFGIQKLFVFGSVLHPHRFEPDSDVDFLYKMTPGQTESAPHPDIFDMHEALEKLVGRKVDLIDLTRISNPYFIQSVNQNKLKIYEA